MTVCCCRDDCVLLQRQLCVRLSKCCGDDCVCEKDRLYVCVHVYVCACRFDQNRVRVCVCVCVYACTNLCMHACMYVCMYVCMYGSIDVRMYVYM